MEYFGEANATNGDWNSTVYYPKLPQSVVITYCVFNVAAVIINIAQYIGLRAMPKIIGLENFFFFLKNLSLMDASMGLLRALISAKATQRYMVNARWLCISSAVLSHSFLLVMSCILLLVSVDRAIALKKGANYSRIQFVVHFQKITFFTMALVFVMYSTIGITCSNIGFEVKGLGACKFGTEMAPKLGLISVGSNFVNLMLIITVYVYVLVMSKKILQVVNKSMDDIIFTIGLIIGAKIVFWCPIMMAVIMRGLDIHCGVCEWIGLLTMSLNSIANPLLYGVTNKSYRRFATQKLKQSMDLTF